MNQPLTPTSELGTALPPPEKGRHALECSKHIPLFVANLDVKAQAASKMRTSLPTRGKHMEPPEQDEQSIGCSSTQD